MSDVASARTTGGQLGERRLGTIHAVAQAPAIGPMFSTAIVLDEPVRPGVRRRAFGTDDFMLVMNHCEPGMTVRPHSHDSPGSR